MQHEGIALEQPAEAFVCELSEFDKLLKDMDKDLYPGCDAFSSLSFILHLYHIKCLCGWTEKSFTLLIELLIRAFPKGVSLPKSFYEAKKIIQVLGLNYEKLHSCIHDCMLF